MGYSAPFVRSDTKGGDTPERHSSPARSNDTRTVCSKEALVGVKYVFRTSPPYMRQPLRKPISATSLLATWRSMSTQSEACAQTCTECSGEDALEDNTTSLQVRNSLFLDRRCFELKSVLWASDEKRHLLNRYSNRSMTCTTAGRRLGCV